MNITQNDVRYRRFFQAHYFDRSLYVCHSHSADMYVTEYRSAFTLRFGRHFTVFQIQYDSFLFNVAHYDVADTNIFNDSSPSTGRLNTDSTICSVKHAIRNSNFTHTPTHLAADNNASVTGKHGAVGDSDILARYSQTTGLRISSRLDCDAIVSY